MSFVEVETGSKNCTFIPEVRVSFLILFFVYDVERVRTQSTGAVQTECPQVDPKLTISLFLGFRENCTLYLKETRKG